MNGFLLTGILLSLLNVAISSLFRKYYPREVNSLVGYRTRRSMRSKDAWTFANQYASDFLFRCSLAIPVIQIILYVFLDPPVALLALVAVWIACLFYTILRTEVMLRRKGF